MLPCWSLVYFVFPSNALAYIESMLRISGQLDNFFFLTWRICHISVPIVIIEFVCLFGSFVMQVWIQVWIYANRIFIKSAWTLLFSWNKDIKIFKTNYKSKDILQIQAVHVLSKYKELFKQILKMHAKFFYLCCSVLFFLHLQVSSLLWNYSLRFKRLASCYANEVTSCMQAVRSFVKYYFATQK